MDIRCIADKCTGCSACLNTCPKSAIAMAYNKDGFLYPQIDESLCIDCGRCVTVCPESEKPRRPAERLQAYGGAVSDAQIVKKSSSGGAFTLMAERILSENGVVFGAAFCPEDKTVVYASTDEVDLDQLRRSKYVAPDPNTAFKKVKAALQEERLVLFCGLPCHVAGLHNYLGKEYETLITCDFVCGGVLSVYCFKDHLKSLENKYHGHVTDVNFRPKLYGWKEHAIKIRFSNGKVYRNHANCDRFFTGFFTKAFKRDSCYACAYRTKHYADVIVADYWGGVKEHPGNNQGLSMVIANSPRGAAFLETLMGTESLFGELPLQKTEYAFRERQESFADWREKATFFDLYAKYGFKRAGDKTYFKKAYIQKAKIRIKRLIGKLPRINE